MVYMNLTFNRLPVHPVIRLSYFQNFIVYDGYDEITLENKDTRIVLKKPEMRPGDKKLILAMMPQGGGKMTPKLVVLCEQPSTVGGTNETCPICLQTMEEMEEYGIAVDMIVMKPDGLCGHVACRGCYQLAIKRKMKKNTENSDVSEFCFLCNC